ncbi:hypothetical protein CH275_07845 [Rhodococcus sp. 06-235-1A]|nr:hypothetical protein CH275_07845 [Rhodococcus sp. 06-235-1A]
MAGRSMQSGGSTDRIRCVLVTILDADLYEIESGSTGRMRCDRLSGVLQDSSHTRSASRCFT